MSKNLLLITRFINILKVNYTAKNKFCVIPQKKLILAILYWLNKYGYIAGYKRVDTKYILVYFKYSNYKSIVLDFQLYSKPSVNYFISYKDLLKYKNSSILYILNTTKGVLTQKEALKYKIGGHLLFNCHISTS